MVTWMSLIEETLGHHYFLVPLSRTVLSKGPPSALGHVSWVPRDSIRSWADTNGILVPSPKLGSSFLSGTGSIPRPHGILTKLFHF